MDIHELKGNIETCAVLTFSRSSGPGGQNVNKRSTQVHAHIAVKDIFSLSEMEKQAVRKHLSTRINNNDELTVRVQNSRSQWANRQRAIEKLVSLILSALEILNQKKRKPTRPNRAARESRLKTKHYRSSVKKQRKSRFTED
ncbi:MAG: aminoacyl-tRNA hydrolase [Spirochaetales bacterium]|nr:aminoacyl-tRNA hydrolase [Spirochaetales bacterium]